MIKMPTILIVTVFLVIVIILTPYFWGFEEWIKQTRASFSILAILNTLGIYIFAIFCILKFLRLIFPKINKYIIDSTKFVLTYNALSCIILTLLIPLIVLNISFTAFLLHHSITSFIYLFGVETICIKIFS